MYQFKSTLYNKLRKSIEAKNVFAFLLSSCVLDEEFDCEGGISEQDLQLQPPQPHLLPATNWLILQSSYL